MLIIISSMSQSHLTLTVQGLANGALGWAISAGDSEYLASARHLGFDGARQVGGVFSSAKADFVLTGLRPILLLCISVQQPIDNDLSKGSDAFEWFGHSATFLDTSARTVAVGSPAFADCSQGPVRAA